MTNARPSSMPGATSPRWPAAGFLATLGRPGIVLLIAKLERSARNVALLCRLLEAGVDLIRNRPIEVRIERGHLVKGKEARS